MCKIAKIVLPLAVIGLIGVALTLQAPKLTKVEEL